MEILAWRRSTFAQHVAVIPGQPAAAPGIHFTAEMRLNGFPDVQLHIKAHATRALRCAIAHRGMTEEARRRGYFTVSAPALQATASWSTVAPLQPTAPMILPPSTSGMPPGDAVGGGESSVAM